MRFYHSLFFAGNALRSIFVRNQGGVVVLLFILLTPRLARGRRVTEKLRDEALLALSTPILFAQGTKDRLCPLDLLADVRRRMTAPNALHIVEGGDHSLLVAKTALKAVALFECRLHGVQGAIGLGQAFDGGDLSALRLERQHIAGLDALTIDDHGARPALGCIAAHVGAGQVQRLPEHLDQKGVGLNLQGDWLVVHVHVQLHSSLRVDRYHLRCYQ